LILFISIYAFRLPYLPWFFTFVFALHSRPLHLHLLNILFLETFTFLLRTAPCAYSWLPKFHGNFSVPYSKISAVLGGHSSWTACIFDMGIESCPETSVNYFQSKQHNICSERTQQLQGWGTLKSIINPVNNFDLILRFLYTLAFINTKIEVCITGSLTCFKMLLFGFICRWNSSCFWLFYNLKYSQSFCFWCFIPKFRFLFICVNGWTHNKRRRNAIYFLLMHVPCIFYCFITTNNRSINITTVYTSTVSLYIIYTTTYFDFSVSSSGSFKFVPCQVTWTLKTEAVKITIP
jgi:hypothetical protein